MMNENSPICARLMPACTDVRTPLPVRNAPIDDADQLADDDDHGQHQHRRQVLARPARGSISMPTETKNTAANTSRTGSMRCSMILRRARLGDQRAGQERAERDRVAESSAPAARTRSRRRRWRRASSRCCRSRTTARTSRGTISIPPTSSTARKPASLPTLERERAAPRGRRPRRPRSGSPAAGSRSGPRRSGCRTRSRRSRPLTFCSSNALTMIVVLEIASAAPGEQALVDASSRTARADQVAEPEHEAALDDGDDAGGRRRPGSACAG